MAIDPHDRPRGPSRPSGTSTRADRRDAGSQSPSSNPVASTPTPTITPPVSTNSTPDVGALPDSTPALPVTPNTPAPTPTPNMGPIQNVDEMLQEALDLWNLGDMFNEMIDLFDQGVTIDEMVLAIRGTDKFKERFPIIAILNDQNLPPVSVEAILNYEQDMRRLGVEAGLPQEFYNNHEYIQEIMADGKSINEVRSVMNDVFAEVNNADPAVKQWAAENYGINGPQALAAMALDSEVALPALLQIAESIKIGGAGVHFGFDIDKDRALQVTKRGATSEAAYKAFGQLSATKGLFEETVSETKDLTVANQGLDFALGQSDGRDVQDRAARRRKAFGGTGGVQSGNQGLTGL